MDSKINWKQKLTSRKFWVAVIGFVVPLLIAFGFSDADITQVTAIIMGGAALIAYTIGEGLVDSARVSNECNQEISAEELADFLMPCDDINEQIPTKE